MEKQISIRLPEPLHKRLVALAQNPPEALRQRGTVTVSAVLREALVQGVTAMERQAREGE